MRKEGFRISVEASNTLIGMADISEFPFWIGTREAVENGTRYIYEAAQEDAAEYSLITFTKKTADGRVVKRFGYKITGDTVELSQ